MDITNYIVLDLEFNQVISSYDINNGKSRYINEIIQIGAIKLDLNFNTVDTFNRYIKPTFNSEINSFITELTGITSEQLVLEEQFPEVFKSFTNFIDGLDSVFCMWGMSDIKELFKSAEYHELDHKHLPRKYINLQPFASIYLGLPPRNLLRLQIVVEMLNIPLSYQFHNALYDTFYTAEIFKKIYNPFIQPNIYNPIYIIAKTRQRRKEVDIDKLLKQFEKMFQKILTEEEQEMIQLAYKMGKTNQFLK